MGKKQRYFDPKKVQMTEPPYVTKCFFYPDSKENYRQILATKMGVATPLQAL